MPPKKTAEQLRLARNTKALQITKAKARAREEFKQTAIKEQTDIIFNLRPTKSQIKRMLNNALLKRGINVPSMVHKTLVQIIHNYKKYKLPKKTRKPRKVKIINNVINTGEVENLDDDAQIDADYEYLLNKYR